MPLLPHISVAIPLMDELENLPALVECLNKQTYRNFSVYMCVNQPESWWEEEVPTREEMLYGLEKLKEHQMAEVC